MHTQRVQINREIARLENIYPDDNLISSYKDFLEHRNYLHMYQYNEAVFVSLIDLAYGLWDTKKRINRSSLIEVSKRYLKKAKTKENIPSATVSKILELFKVIVLCKNENLSKETIDRIKKAINSILIGIELDDDKLQWLCDNSEKSPFIFNRVLRYKYKSSFITNWAKENFESDIARERRSEVTSWVIDEDPNFKLDREIAESDFEFQLAEDKRLVQSYIDDVDTANYFNSQVSRYMKLASDSTATDKVDIPEIPMRIYNKHARITSGYDIGIPDFERAKREYYESFDLNYNRIMAWSIAYSRISNTKKAKLLSDYFSDGMYPTLYTIGKRLKSIELFMMIKQRLKEIY